MRFIVSVVTLAVACVGFSPFLLAEQETPRGALKHFPQHAIDRIGGKALEKAAPVVIRNLSTNSSERKAGNAKSHRPDHAGK